MKEAFQCSFPYYKKKLWILVLCMIMGLMRVIILLVEPQIITLMVDRVIYPALGQSAQEDSSIFTFLIRDIDENKLWTIMGVLVSAFLFFIVLYFILFYSRWHIAHYFSLQCENEMRKDALNKINTMGPSLLKKFTCGDLITITNTDPSRLRDLYIATIPFIMDAVFYIIMAAYFLSRCSVILMVVPILTLGFYVLIARNFLKMCGKLYDKLWKDNSALNTETQESIYGIRTMKAFGREKHRFERFQQKSEILRDSYIEIGSKKYKYFVTFDLMDLVVKFSSIIMSIYLASKFRMTGGEYAAFLTYLLTLIGQFVNIIFHLADMQDYGVSGKRLASLLGYKEEALEEYGNLSVKKRPNIEVNDVCIAVETSGQETKYLLDHVSVSIPYGKRVGIMGKTGSGKSVLLKALQAFMECDEGRITIDGKLLKEYDRGEIARTYSYAMQDIFLFSNTIAANIAYYDPDASDERIEECGRIAEVEQFAKAFPDGYQTIVGEKGFGLSGGQKQRVAIARAMLKDAPVIVLDDCTSALDVETESKIFAHLNQAVQGRTLLMATHRAHAIKDFDEILFFEDGKIVERGTFEELMKLDGHYAGIYKRQTESEVYVSE